MKALLFALALMALVAPAHATQVQVWAYEGGFTVGNSYRYFFDEQAGSPLDPCQSCSPRFLWHFDQESSDDCLASEPDGVFLDAQACADGPSTSGSVWNCIEQKSAACFVLELCD